MEKLKLSKKQLDILLQIQQQKQQASALIQELNGKEGVIVDLILDANNINGATVNEIKLDGEYITFSHKEKSKKAKPE